jgi:hypothetical protein
VNSTTETSDISLDHFVAQAVEPIKALSRWLHVCTIHGSQCAGIAVRTSPLQMWLQNEDGSWYAGTVQDSMDRSMRAYVLFWQRTGWRLIQLKHLAPENWTANLLNQDAWQAVTGAGATPAIAICEAIKAASQADTEAPKRDAESSAIL